MRNTVIGLGCTLILACSGRPARAQDADSTGAASPTATDLTAPVDASAGADAGGFHWSLAGGASYRLPADLDGGGDVSLSRHAVAWAGQLPLDERWSAALGMGYEIDQYDFTGDTALGGDPWDTIHTLRLRAVLNRAIDEQWSVYGGPIITFAAQDGADWADALSAGGVLGAAWQVDPNLSIGAGVLALTRIEDDLAVFPVIRFNWRLDEAWTLRSGSFDLGSEGGAGVELGWRFTEAWELAGGAQYQTRRFRLDNSGQAPDGVGEERAVPIYLRLTWSPSQRLSASLLGGVTVAGRLQLDSADGHEIADDDFDPAPMLGARVTLRF